MTELTALHQHGLTHHQTTPLRRHGITTVEHLARLARAHRAEPDGSELSDVPGIGPRRVTALCESIDRWTTETGAGR